MQTKSLKSLKQQLKNRRRSKRQRGMTLVEIMVVITIIGLITAAVAVAVIPKLAEAREQTARSDIKNIENALDLYKMKKGSYPSTSEGLKALVDTQNLKDMPKDPWGETYIYMLDSGKPVVLSYGADKQAGGEGENADISNVSQPSQQQ